MNTNQARTGQKVSINDVLTWLCRQTDLVTTKQCMDQFQLSSNTMRSHLSALSKRRAAVREWTEGGEARWASIENIGLVSEPQDEADLLPVRRSFVDASTAPRIQINAPVWAFNLAEFVERRA